MKKNYKEQIASFLINPLIIALPLALMTILLLPTEFSKFNLRLIKANPANKKGLNTIQYYHDLDGDECDELISHFENSIKQCAIKVNDGNGNYLGQWNFNGSLPSNSRNLTYLDYDGNGTLEIFTVYQRQDSIFLGGIDIHIDSEKILDDLFVDKINSVNGTSDFTTNLYNYDLDNDNQNEILITISAGYSEQPRQLYAYNFSTQTLKKSPVVGFKTSLLQFDDLDNDGKVEIVPATVSCENIESNLGIPCNDYHRWFTVYDDKLQFKLKPINIGRGSGGIMPHIFNSDDTAIVLLQQTSRKTSQWTQFLVYDAYSNKLSELDLKLDSTQIFDSFKYHDVNKEFLALYFPSTGKLILYDPENSFAPFKTHRLLPRLDYLQQLDISNNNQVEYVFLQTLDDQQSLIFYTNDFKSKYRYSIPAKYSGITHISMRNVCDGNKHLKVQLDEDIIELKPETDPYYLVKIIGFQLLILGFYYFFIWLILYTQKRILKKSYTQQQTIAELKLKTIRNQLDPHFTFNAINAIAAAIYNEDKQIAYNYFSMFSKLLRTTLLYSDKIVRTLKDEIEFTIQYLNIEKFRYRDKFEYSISIDERLNMMIEVPRMIIQAFAETAVSNGLMHRQTGGKLNIRIQKEGNLLTATFEDNGVGVIESKRLNKQKAFKSLKTMNEFIAIFNELNKTNITYEITSLDESVDFPGTRIVVYIPMIEKYPPGKN